MIEFVNYILEQNKFFIYGVVSWSIIYFFEGEKPSFTILAKIIIYGIITSFSYNIVIGFEMVDITNNSRVMVASVASSTFIQLFLIPTILDKDTLKRVKSYLLNKIK